MKNYIFLLASVIIFAGCNANNQPQPKEQPVVQEKVVEEKVEEKEVVKKKVVKQKTKKTTGTYYRMVTKSIEVFSYKGRLSTAIQIDEKKLKNPFYIKGNLIKIEKVYDSSIGEQYGKIAGKNLLVSMDDLTTYTKK
ncbi:hypothetical protein [Arcobacter sp. LA11]|uniref:hypothetical protein n=1 Tax=Arcobacter sp. LA11 TaxID=1898176 RepID=UPI000934DCD6|nr:hypothetical protein [Arcobacter sp. LA11]